MSRKGKIPIPIPEGVEIKMKEDVIYAKGPKGSTSLKIIKEIQLHIKDSNIEVSLAPEYEEKKNLHGLYRSLVANVVSGVKEGFEKKLEMVGVGYRAAVQGKNLDLSIGLSHPTKIPIPEDLTVSVEKNVLITIHGMDKQKVGQFAADIRSKKPPEPYKGKGIRYQNEYVRRKAGKTAKK